jgi:hypothetical protein
MISAIQKRLDSLSGNKTARELNVSGTTIAVPLTWPNLKNAEYEVIMRLCHAAENIGVRVIVTDNDGYPLWASDESPVQKNRRVTSRDADFAISLHFESPRLFDLYSYYAIWQPLSFYSNFGYRASTAKLSTHCDALSCESELADAHIRNLMGIDSATPRGDFPNLFHSPQGPYMEPKITNESRLFYVGINWERITGSPGRYTKLLNQLDQADLVDIYGPRQILGVAPWEGFESYRGEIPFDGHSVVDAVNRSGICIALSSDSHTRDGIMSNRFFEGAAAGAAIIAPKHPIIDKFFADLVYEIPEVDDEADMYFYISGIVKTIRDNPEAATERALEIQSRVRDYFSPESCLKALITQHADREALYYSTEAKPAAVDVVLPHTGEDVEALVAVVQDLAAQEGMDVHLTLVSEAQHETADGVEAGGAIRSVKRTILPADAFIQPRVTYAQLVHQAVQVGTSDYVMIASAQERYFKDHLGTLVAALSSDDKASVSMSGLLAEDESGERSRRTLIESDTQTYTVSDLSALSDGAWLFRRAWACGIGEDRFVLSGGNLSSMLVREAALHGDLARSQRTTCVVKIDATGSAPSKSDDVGTIHLLDDRALFAATGFEMDDVVFASQGAAGGTANDHDGLDEPAFLRVGQDLAICKGSPGLSGLKSGFSNPEEQAVWIDGRHATLEFDLVGLADAEQGSQLELVLHVAGRSTNSGGRPNQATITVNGLVRGVFTLSEHEKELVVPLPQLADLRPRVKIDITLSHAEQVLALDGTVSDPRFLGARLHFVNVRLNETVAFVPVSFGLDYTMGRQGSGRGLIGANAVLTDNTIEIGTRPVVMRVRIPETQQDVVAAFKAKAIGNVPDTTLIVSFGNQCSTEVPMDGDMKRHEIVIPKALIAGNPRQSLSFATKSISDNATHVDMASVTFHGRIVVQAMTDYFTATGRNGVGALARGFSRPEDLFTWVDSPTASLDFALSPDLVGKSLTLVMSVGLRAGVDWPYKVEFEANGAPLTCASLEPGTDTLSVPLPSSVTRTSTVSISIKGAAVGHVTRGDGTVIDPRTLSFFVKSFRLQTERSRSKRRG